MQRGVYLMLAWLMNLGFAASVEAITVPTVPGLEYTAPDGRLHYTAPTARLHYSADGRLHYTARADE